MPTLHIHLLGDFRLSCDEAPVRTINAPRLHALLSYLLLHRDAPQPRHHLAFLLWPDTTEAQARTNLRQLLHDLKQALPAADLFVSTSATTVQWRPEAPFRLDVADFEQALIGADGAEQEQHRDAHTSRKALEQAIALYHGDLLPSCYDDWILPERERLRQAFTGALQGVLRLLERAGQPREAIPYAERLLRHDPQREETYRALMRLHASCGDRAGVVRVYHTCTSVLSRELGVEPSTATREAYAYLLKVEIQAPPVVLPQKALSNLPVQLTSFVGRERELAELKPLLSSSRLLTLTGPGGIGKTRLALQLAGEVQETFAAGVWLVDLAALSDPTLVIPTIAATLGVREQPRRPLLDALLDYVRTKRLLLLLDNCEHVIEPCAQLADTLLRAAPGVRIVASSREALGIAGETTYRVPSLALPDPRHLQDLAHNDCVHLFVDRAQAAYPGFRLTARNAPAIVQICQHLDGIPLALELAAARTRVFPPEQLAARLSDRFRLLTGGSRTALPRHQTLVALLDWSHQLLSETERVLLRRLSVFAGGWSWEAAQAVCGEALGEEVLDPLVRLVDKSMVVVEESLEVAEGRYRLLEIIRQYAREKLLEAGEAEALRERHLAYFLRFAKEAEPKLRAALAWALDRGKSDRALELAGALSYFWLLRGYFSEGCKWLDDALALWEREQREKGAAGTEPPPPVERAHRARALGAAGLFHGFTLNLKRARTLVEESLRVWRELGDTWGMAVALEQVGFLSGFTGDGQTALARLEEGVSLAREIEDRWPLAVCMVRLGGWVSETDVAAARRILEEAVAVARSVGDRSVLSNGLSKLSSLYYVAGDLTAAASLVEEAMAAARAIGDVAHAVPALLQVVIIACLQNNPAKAKRYSDELWALSGEMGNPMAAVFALWAFGLAASFGGEPERGVRLLAAFEVFFGQHGFKLSEGDPSIIVLRQAQARAQAQLDPAAFEVALAEGQQMTMEQALAYATEHDSEAAPLPEAGLGPGPASLSASSGSP